MVCFLINIVLRNIERKPKDLHLKTQKKIYLNSLQKINLLLTKLLKNN